jgi:4-hydroxy-2-oxoheptanedioate aldolase
MAALRDLIHRPEPTLGGWCGLPTTFSVELMARAGFDWLCIDSQHGLMGPEALDGMIAVATALGVPTMVRVAWNDASMIMKALDAGADGVIVPLVDSADQARAAVDACRYPPDGHRSWGPTRPALRTAGFTPELGNRLVACVVMVETVESMAALDDIVRVPGIDAVFVGPSDLALTHGIPPMSQVWGDEHAGLLRTIVEACQDAGVTPGIACPDADWAERWRSAGYRMLAIASDGAFLGQGAAAAVSRLRSSPARTPASEPR